jgi:hypothetical protein
MRHSRGFSQRRPTYFTNLWYPKSETLAARKLDYRNQTATLDEA